LFLLLLLVLMLLSWSWLEVEIGQWQGDRKLRGNGPWPQSTRNT
jgi:hypothetical protein